MSSTSQTSPRKRLYAYAAALLLGAAGGGLFYILHLPLPWMIGAMTATLVASLLRIPIRAPSAVRPPMVTVIGVMLGASLTMQSLGGAKEWLVPALGLVVFLTVSAICCIGYFRHIARFELRTAYFSGMPGGIVEMVMMGEQEGADSRTIALIHAARIVIVVFSVPFIVGVIAGDFSRIADPPPVVPTPLLESLVWLVTVCVFGVVLGHLLRLPARDLVGPMLLSSVLHVSGVTTFTPSVEVVAIAQVAIGTTLGARFAGIQSAAIIRILLHAGGSVAILLLLTTAFAFGVSAMSDIRPEHLFLAYSPGGLAEMGLVALALHVDVALVIVLHIARVLLVAFGARLVFRISAKRLAP